MKKALRRSELWGVLFTLTAGFLCHFFYQWSGQQVIVGLFAPVNESTWEHLKLLYFPFMCYTLVQYYLVGKDYDTFCTAKLIGVLLGMAFIVTAFYTYTGIIGHHNLFADILIFICSVLITYLTSCYLLLYRTDIRLKPPLSFLAFLLLTGFFFVATYTPPDLPLFISP